MEFFVREFVQLVGMTLPNMVVFRSALTHARCIGLSGGRFLICKSRLVAATFLHFTFWTRISGVTIHGVASTLDRPVERGFNAHRVVLGAFVR